MVRKLSVLLVEDDQNDCNKIAEYADTVDDVSLIGITNSSDTAINDIKEGTTDAVILDLELHEGAGSGIKFLQELQALQLNSNPYILVTTNNSSKITHEFVRKLGADFIMSKHQSDYSPKTAIDFLCSMKEIIQSKTAEALDTYSTTEAPEQKAKRLTRKITYEMDCIGISPKAVGYNYLVDAISLIIIKPQPNICSVIAAKYNKSDASVERAMQNAINKAWRTTDIDDLLVHYTARINSEKGMPTITEFIYYYANKIKNDC